jgi:hypothetical protein
VSEEPYPIRVNCICGQAYDGPRWALLQCPHCRHVWNLYPGHPKTPRTAKVGIPAERFQVPVKTAMKELKTVELRITVSVEESVDPEDVRRMYDTMGRLLDYPKPPEIEIVTPVIEPAVPNP